MTSDPSALTSDPDVPIPLPDVPGADAGADGLPDRSDLTAWQRAVIDSSAFADIGLRTAIATVVGAAVLPTVAGTLVNRAEARRERDNLAFYADLATRRDASLYLSGSGHGSGSQIPPRQPARRVHRPRAGAQQLVRERLRADQPRGAGEVARLPAQ